MGNSFLNGNPMQKNPDGSWSVTKAGVGNPPLQVAAYDATAQQANIASTPIYTVPANGGGMYRLCAYAVITQAATTSSTLPFVQMSWTDGDSSTALSGYGVISSGQTQNTIGTNSVNSGGVTFPEINVKAGSTISINIGGYASSGATPMQYAVHVRLEYLG